MKAVLQYRASAGFSRLIQQHKPEWLNVVIVDENDKDSFAKEMQTADVLLHVLEPVTRDVILNASQLKLIQKIGVGVNTIDLASAKERGVRVANMPGTNSQAVAEFAMLAMLELLRRSRWFAAETRAGRGWQLGVDAFDALGELHGKTIGLVGLGDTATRLAPALSALGASVLYTARHIKPDHNVIFVDLDTLLAESDIVSLHLSYNNDTHHMMNAQRFAQMKCGSYFVNLSRGGLVDESALIAALESGHLAGAALDVFAQEPAPADSPLLHRDNVLALPHIAWQTPETLQRSLSVAFENCRRIRDGESLLHPVV